MKILMVSGFLGAGKTTFIKTMAQRSGRDFVVLENEYGQADIDSQLLQSQTDLDVYELTQGCVCCTLKQDFAASVLTIANTLDPEILIVEPTGVARLSSLEENVSRIEYERISLLAPVTIVDGLAFEKQLSRDDAIFFDQVANAATLVVSKTEHLDEEERGQIESRLRSMNSEAEIVFSPYAGRDADWFASLLDRGLDGQDLSAPVSDDELHMETFGMHGVALDSPAKLIALLDAISFGVFGTVLRAKGILPCNGAWLRFDVVDGTWGITGFDGTAPDTSEAVFIGQDLKRPWLRELLLSDYHEQLERKRRS